MPPQLAAKESAKAAKFAEAQAKYDARVAKDAAAPNILGQAPKSAKASVELSASQ